MNQRVLPLACALLACALLVSCASVPRSKRHAQRELTQYTWARSFEAPVGEWPTREWWTTFNDPQLDRLIGEAIADPPTLAQADARLREARHRTQAAGSALWPSLSATAAARKKLTYNGIFPADVVPRGYNWMGNATLDLSWEVDFWGKNRKALSAAVSQAKAVQADAAAARLLLAVAVVRSYVQLQDFRLSVRLPATLFAIGRNPKIWFVGVSRKGSTASRTRSRPRPVCVLPRHWWLKSMNRCD